MHWEIILFGCVRVPVCVCVQHIGILLEIKLNSTTTKQMGTLTGHGLVILPKKNAIIKENGTGIVNIISIKVP